jgi:hypothetical protein
MIADSSQARSNPAKGRRYRLHGIGLKVYGIGYKAFGIRHKAKRKRYMGDV